MIECKDRNNLKGKMFTDRLTKLRQARGWTKKEFSVQIGKTQQTVGKWENGTNAPTFKDLVKLVELFGVTSDYLLGLSDSPSKYAYPPFNDNKEEYVGEMFKQLDEAITTLTANRTLNFSPKADKVYGGNVEKWIKFGNSLRLRLAIRISKTDPALAKHEAEASIANEVGVMTSNDDNAFMTLSNTNPFRVVMYEYNGGDSRVGADITTYMNGYNDPRRDVMFTKSSFASGTNGYYGLRSGIQIAYSNYNVNTDSKLMWMNAAEVAFLRAEGALKNWNMGGTAGDFYKTGVELSFEQWGAKGATAYLADNSSTPAVYTDPAGLNSYSGSVSTITIAWDDSNSEEQKLERIITQKWLAMFPLGLEAWADYRRTGFPKLMPVKVNNSGGIVNSERGARRLSYPQEERRDNTVNYNAALGMLGGADNMATDVWWAK